MSSLGLISVKKLSTESRRFCLSLTRHLSSGVILKICLLPFCFATIIPARVLFAVFVFFEPNFIPRKILSGTLSKHYTSRVVKLFNNSFLNELNFCPFVNVCGVIETKPVEVFITLSKK